MLHVVIDIEEQIQGLINKQAGLHQLKTRLKGELESQQPSPVSSKMSNEYHHRSAKQVMGVVRENYK